MHSDRLDSRNFHDVDICELFTREFLMDCIKTYAPMESQALGSVEVRYENCDYHPETSIPVMYINEEEWMSLSTFELVTNYMPVARAHGRVAILGLGLGLAAIAISLKSQVSLIDVYEINSDIISMFKKNFPKSKHKINIIEGDARCLFRGKAYDYLYSDIYLSKLDAAILDDIKLFTEENNVGSWHFWSSELSFCFNAINYDVSLSSAKERELSRLYLEKKLPLEESKREIAMAIHKLHYAVGQQYFNNSGPSAIRRGGTY